MEAENRAHPRKNIELPIVLIATSYLSTKISHAKSLDFSEGGLSVLTSESLNPGQHVSIEFTQPAMAQLMQVRAVVRYCSRDRYGMEFLSSSPEQAHSIRLMVGTA